MLQQPPISLDKFESVQTVDESDSLEIRLEATDTAAKIMYLFFDKARACVEATDSILFENAFASTEFNSKRVTS